MFRVRNLELLFSLEKKNIKSKEDCVVVVLHTLLDNDNFGCLGTGDDWPKEIPEPSQLLPENWNANPDIYSLRYISKDKKYRILLKVTKMEHMLIVDCVRNEVDVVSMSIPVSNYISDDYNEYSSAFKDLESLSTLFRKNIIEKLDESEGKIKIFKKSHKTSVPPPPVPSRPQEPLRPERPPMRDPFPRIGEMDLNPFAGPGASGMLMDPSSFGIPARPTLPEFGVGGPGGLPRGAVPPGARFDPFMPPIRRPDIRRDPNQPPGFEDFM